MTTPCCAGYAAEDLQFDVPTWEPLREAVGMRLADGFMWMQEQTLPDGTAVQAYKHIHTRRYLYLADGARAFEAACGRFVRLRLDFAIQRALCTWWLLSGWEQEDADAIREAIEAAQAKGAGRG